MWREDPAFGMLALRPHARLTPDCSCGGGARRQPADDLLLDFERQVVCRDDAGRVEACDDGVDCGGVGRPRG